MIGSGRKQETGTAESAAASASEFLTLSSPALDPAFHVALPPHAALGEFSAGLREFVGAGELIGSLAADAEAFAYLGCAHQVHAETLHSPLDTVKREVHITLDSVKRREQDMERTLTITIEREEIVRAARALQHEATRERALARRATGAIGKAQHIAEAQYAEELAEKMAALARVTRTVAK